MDEKIPEGIKLLILLHTLSNKMMTKKEILGAVRLGLALALSDENQILEDSRLERKRKPKPKTILTAKQKKVRVKNKIAKKSRKVNRN